MTKLRKGDFVRVEFDAWADGELFDTTHRDVAEEAKKARDEVVYEPLPLVLGAGRALVAFEDALLEAEVGVATEVHIPPERAFGPRDPSNVATVSSRRFQEQGLKAEVGKRVQYNGETATVVAASAGRVRLDFNHPLAGKTLTYRFRVLEVVTEPAERVRAVVALRYGMERGKEFDVRWDGNTVVLGLPRVCRYDQRWFVAKNRLAEDLIQHLDVGGVRFVEEHRRGEPPGIAPDEPARSDSVVSGPLPEAGASTGRPSRRARARGPSGPSAA